MSRPGSAAAQALPLDDLAKTLIHPLPPVFPFGWAVAHGWDRWGPWQAFEFAGQRQRLRWLPPGSFLMGSPDDEHSRSDNEKQHPVRLSQGLWLADTAVTQALWAAVLGGDQPAYFKGDTQCPVEQVSWNDVVGRFLPALNAAMPGLAARLPTEAEWEYGCREAGHATGPFSFGSHINPDQVNYNFRSYRPKQAVTYRERTVPVGSLPANASGLFEMHGNVLEWCADVYRAAYPQELGEDPCVGAEGAFSGRVFRGGSWTYDMRKCRSASRFVNQPDFRDYVIGFRLARGPLPEATAAGGAAPRRDR